MPDALEIYLTVTVPKVVPSVHLFSLIVTRSQSFFHPCLYIPVAKTPQKLKIAKPWKTSQEVTWICLEVYSLDFDMTTINQFSQLCSRSAAEKDIILLDRLF